MKKTSKMNEAAWLLGILLCGLGVALCTKANFGLSMIAAPPYILHLKLQTVFSFYTQGTSEYIWQAALLILLCVIIRRFSPKFLLSFGTAVLSGLAIDFWIFVLGGGAPYGALWLRILVFAFGELITALAIAFFFRTSLPLQIYELIVTEIARKFGKPTARIKQISDGVMLAIAVLFAAFVNRAPDGIGIGTLIITAVNAPLINLFGKGLDKYFVFDPRFPKLTEKLKV